MEYFLRFLQFVIKIIYLIVHPLLHWLLPLKEDRQRIPPIRNHLVTLSIGEVVKEMRQGKLKSVDLVAAYISRIREVNPHINAIVADRFDEALVDAKHADDLMSKCNQDNEKLEDLFNKYPILGIPFTVKESCGLKGMPLIVGSILRNEEKCPASGETIELLITAGGIPLLISVNPEYCFSIETNTYTHGKCLNPYDSTRTCGGSSGGEGALNGSGATLFGIGSDIAGSIRIPSLFNGVFGHKPTGGVTSVRGHFPDSCDPVYNQYLQIGSLTRFAKDLPLLLHIMAGENASKLDLLKPLDVNSIRIHYAIGFEGLNGFLHQTVAHDIQMAIVKAVDFFDKRGHKTERAYIENFKNSTEIALSGIVRLTNFPYLMTNPKKPIVDTLKEYAKSAFGISNYTRDGLIFELMRRANAFMPEPNLLKYKTEAEMLKSEIISLLGNDGVLFFPTFHVHAIHHQSSHLPLWGIDYSLIFNILGLPATHVPMGMDSTGMPIGFQVIASPLMDKLCLKIAAELEEAFGGWTPPAPHNINN